MLQQKHQAQRKPLLSFKKQLHAKPSRRKVIPFLLLFAMILFQGCRTTTSINKAQVQPFSPQKIKVGAHYTDIQLFEKGSEAFESQKYITAERLFSRLLKEYPKSTYTVYTMYNIALTYERLKRFDSSIRYYKRLILEKPKTEEAQNAHFRMAANFLTIKKWPEAEAAYLKVTALKGIDVSDRLEGLASLGIAQYKQKKFLEAEDAFRQTIRLFRKASRGEYLGNDYFASMAQHHIGRIYDNKFRHRKFRETKEQMRSDLEFKATNLLKAQVYYIRCIKMRNPDWIVTSLFRIGEMYQKMFKDMVSAPIPKTLDQSLKKAYTVELKKKIRILLTKSIMVFEKNIQAAENLGLQKHVYVKKSRKYLRTIRQFIVSEYLKEPEEGPSEAKLNKGKNNKKQVAPLKPSLPAKSIKSSRSTIISAPKTPKRTRHSD